MPPQKRRSIDPPTDDVMNLRKTGYSNNQIIDKLKRDNYDFDEISSAFNQAEIKDSVSDEEVPLELSNAPSPTQSEEEYLYPFNDPPSTAGQPLPPEGPITRKPARKENSEYQDITPDFAPEPRERASYTMMEEIAESIIKEKWEDMISNLGDLKVWKERTDTELLSVKQEILRTQQRFENLQKAMLGKIQDYNQSITDITSEMKALEGVFEKIITPLTKNIKELTKITQDLKKVR